MMLYQTGRSIDPGKVSARMHGNGQFAMIRLTEDAELFVNVPEEADALITAACEAKRLLLEQRAPADWCPAYTGPDDELDVSVYCDRKAGHPGNHHGAIGGGGEVAWPADPVPSGMQDPKPVVRVLVAEANPEGNPYPDGTPWCAQCGSHHAPAPSGAQDTADKPLVISDSTLRQAEYFAQPGNTIDDLLAAQRAES